MSDSCLFNLPCVKTEDEKTDLKKRISSFAENLGMNIEFGDSQNDYLCQSGKMNLCFYVYNSPEKDASSVDTSFISDFNSFDAYPRFCEHFSFLSDFAKMLLDSEQMKIELFLGNAGETDIHEFAYSLYVTVDHLLMSLFDLTKKEFYKTLKKNNIYSISMPSAKVTIKKSSTTEKTELSYWSFSQDTNQVHKISIVNFAYEDNDAFSVIKTLDSNAAIEAINNLQKISFKPAYWGSHFGLGFLVEYYNGEFDVITNYSPHRYKRITKEEWENVALPLACDKYAFYRLIEKVLFIGDLDSISARTKNNSHLSFSTTTE